MRTYHYPALICRQEACSCAWYAYCTGCSRPWRFPPIRCHGHWVTRPEPGTYTLPVIKPAIDGEVLDAAGVRKRLFDYMDNKIVLPVLSIPAATVGVICPLPLGVLYPR